MSWLKFFSSVLNTFVKHTHPKTRENKIWAQDKTDPQGVGRTETISVVTFECQYRNILESLNLSQNITKPTRVTHTMKSLIDHVISNYPLRVAHTDVLPAPSVSNHDTVYVGISTHELQDMHPVIRNENTYAMRNSLTCKCLNKISCLCLWMSDHLWTKVTRWYGGCT